MSPEQLASDLTDALRTPTGTMVLRPLQARCLWAMYTSGKGVATNGSVGIGKAQPVSEPVLTPEGWKPIGTVRPGDSIIGSDGSPTSVVSVHPQGVKEVWRVTFSDGSWTRCDPEHLWTFRQRSQTKRRLKSGVTQRAGRGSKAADVLGSVWETRTLREWVEQVGLSRPCGKHRAHKLFAPLVQPVVYPEQDFPLDPYTLGALLGDGGMSQRTVNFTSMDPDIVSGLVLPIGVSLRPTACQSGGKATQYNLTTGRKGVTNPLTEILRGLGLMGTKSGTKFIPPEYLRGSVTQRLALLQGLLDTDGGMANPAGGVEYSTLSPRLAADVVELVESLGGTASMGKPSRNGNARIQVKLPRQLPPFRCARKGEPHMGLKPQHGVIRAVHKVESDGHERCVCIRVAAWDSLYVTRHHILTHNSLLMALSMTVVGGDRPLILTEASNIPQMRKDFEEYRAHWHIPSCYRLEAYEAISTHPELLEDYRPTMLGLDEAHKLRRVQKSARARRVDRWRQDNPDVPVIVASGSLGADIEEYAHLLIWGVPSLASTRGGPIPVNDEGQPRGVPFLKFLKRFRDDDDFRRAFWAGVYNTPGVVISSETFRGKPLHIAHHILPTPPEMETHWERLRTLGQAPDEWNLDGLGESWHMARFLANGLYKEHIPRPPEDYRQARKAWWQFVRELVDDPHAPGGPWDTEGQVAKAVLAGKLPRYEYDAWMAVKDTYQPTIQPTWLSGAVVDYAEAWGRERAALATRRSGGSIVWVAQTNLGERISERTGWPFYSDDARNPAKQHVSRATAPVIVCSVHSCGTGKNLQRYSRNLFLSPHSNNDQAEQNIGRTHRPGQQADVVEVEYLYGCLEDWCAIQKAIRLARDTEENLTTPPKLLLAQHDWCCYPDIKEVGLAWQKADKTVTVEIPE